MTDAPPTPEPLLRTLSPLLHTLERDVRGWLDGAAPAAAVRSSPAASSKGWPTTCAGRPMRSTSIGRCSSSCSWAAPGVGKSTLLNALAGGPVAQASFTRPTTRDPVVYYHESVKPDRLDPALRLCRLVPHDRPSLQQKVIVDTPDLDSNDLANREKLKALLPVADIVLYVGSQEKYHDQLGWDLFKEQRQAAGVRVRAEQVGPLPASPDATGLRPDEDLLGDLKDEGFENPLLFRTMAQAWVDAAATATCRPTCRRASSSPTARLAGTGPDPAGDRSGQGSRRRSIARSARPGAGAGPPGDLTAEAERTRVAWDECCARRRHACGEVLVSTLEPYSAEIEHHFRVEGQQKFRGLMAAYLKLTTKLRYAGTSLRDRIPFVPRIDQKVETPTNWNLAAFAHECTRVAGEKVLNQRAGALVNRLLVEADRQRFPLRIAQRADPRRGPGRLAGPLRPGAHGSPRRGRENPDPAPRVCARSCT